MKLIVFLIKTFALLLCLGALGAYGYYTFYAKTGDNLFANASLLGFVLSAVILGLVVALGENKVKVSGSNSGGYAPNLRQEEEFVKQIQKAIPKDLVPTLEKIVDSIDKDKIT